jgi:hypothetical protein
MMKNKSAEIRLKDLSETNRFTDLGADGLKRHRNLQ